MNKKLFIQIFLGFVAMTIIGTLSHELGHLLVAQHFGYAAKINYNETILIGLNQNDLISPKHSIAITMGGPLQTILCGTLGFIFLLLFRKHYFEADELSFVQWLMVFASLFWLRQIVNFCFWMMGHIITKKYNSKMDEIVIANYFDIHEGFIISISAVLGSIIILITLFKFIPLKQRRTFLIAGLLGGIVGYLFWFVVFGKYILN